MTSGEPLAGGFVSTVTRHGDAVHRRPGRNAPFVHALLTHLSDAGWTGAPRFRGIDSAGDEILDFVAGTSGVDPAVRAGVGDDDAVIALTGLVRELHDLTAGTTLAGGQEVVCHHDLDPRNTVYRDRDGRWLPVALIDWDLAGPGTRIQDVARIAWQFLPLGPQVTDVADAARRIDLIADVYGLADRSALVPTVLWWQSRCWQGIERGAGSGDPAMVALRDAGVVASVRSAEDWTRRHRDQLSPS